MMDVISFAAAGTASADNNNAMANFFMLRKSSVVAVGYVWRFRYMNLPLWDYAKFDLSQPFTHGIGVVCKLCG